MRDGEKGAGEGNAHRHDIVVFGEMAVAWILGLERLRMGRAGLAAASGHCLDGFRRCRGIIGLRGPGHPCRQFRRIGRDRGSDPKPSVMEGKMGVGYATARMLMDPERGMGEDAPDQVSQRQIERQLAPVRLGTAGLTSDGFQAPEHYGNVIPDPDAGWREKGGYEKSDRG